MLLRVWTKLIANEHGASMVEYALLVSLIALVAFIAVQLAGRELSSTYTDIANNVEMAGS